MTRYVPVTVLLVVLAASQVASAESGAQGPLASGATITFSELKIHENNSQDAVFPKTDPDSNWHYFNGAHCECARSGVSQKADYAENTFQYLLKLEGANGMTVGRPLEIWVGPDCSDDVQRPKDCQRIDAAGQTSVDLLVNPGNARPNIPLFPFLVPTPMATACPTPGITGNATLWALVDTTGNSIPDYFASTQINIDTQPPTLPTQIEAQGAEGAIELSWKPPDTTTDSYAYQALCALADDDSPVKPSGAPSKALYATAATLCDAETPLALTPIDVALPDGAPDAGPAIALPDAMNRLDSSFLCGEIVSPTASGLRISGLKNGSAYKVALVAADKYGNAVGAYFTSTITPVPSTDFWEDLHGRGSKTQGGFCLLAETYGSDSALTNALRGFRDDNLSGSRIGRWMTEAYYAKVAALGGAVHRSIALRLTAAILLAPVVVTALLWHWLTLPGVLALVAAALLWRRRAAAVLRWTRRVLRARVVQVVAALAVMTLTATRANAGGGYQPYWEDSDPTANEDRAAADDPGLIKWHAGIRVGPYLPDIDRQFAKQVGTSPGPYAQMFGGSRLTPMLDVDRILWTGFGQVGVGISVGYMQKFAHAFTVTSDPSDPNRARAPGDTNTFRLIPTALTAIYRFTWLDDQYGIPVVPYVRGGLSYYLWWLSTSSGTAQVCKDGGMEPSCAQNKARGASLGLQGSIGLAIRAERIDPSTAQSMRQSGIEHAGIYGELSLAKVDGFGSDSKLSVGDRTWFAGVDFEF